MDVNPDVRPGRHEWDRLWFAWHGGFAVLVTVTTVLMGVNPSLGSAERSIAVAALVALAAAYALVGGRLISGEPRGLGRLYLAIAIPSTLTVFAIDPLGSIMLCMLYPHIWMLLEERHAVAVTALSVVGTATAMVVGTDPGPEDAMLAVGVGAAAMMFAMALGMWITRIVAQSRRRAELVAELAAARAELAEASRVAGVNAERERLARDIHDTLAQGFAGLVMLIETARAEIGDEDSVRRRLDRAAEIARENLDEARALVHGLTPAPLLRDAALPDALRRIVSRADDVGSFDVAGTPRRLAPTVEAAILRVAQEAVANAHRHAHATSLDVRLDFADGVRLAVRDDGRGFDVDDVEGGYGLAGMRARVTETGGRMTVASAHGVGTTLTAEWPS